MEEHIIKGLQSKSNEILLDIYLNKRTEYREEALLVIEQILTERKIEFSKIETLPAETQITQKTKIDNKVFIKVLIGLVLLAIFPMFIHINYLEGKLFTNQNLYMFMHSVYYILGFPLNLWQEEHEQSRNYLIPMALLFLNCVWIARLIAYFICKRREEE